MSTEKAAVTEEQAVPAYVQWLNKEGYKLETSVPFEGDTVSWTRPTKYGTIRCTTNGVIQIVVSKVGETFSMSVRGSTPNYWGANEIYNISEDFLVGRGRQLEHRLVDAWREMSA